jgi:serine/threonine protein kinase
LNGTPVAIKKIFDPRLTEELLNEIHNEIVMQSILRHPNIALLMGMMPKIPQIVIVFEYVSQGSLFNLLHHKKSVVQLSIEVRLRIARESALVFQYMHQLGIVHRDIKSHNILIDDNLNVKVCDFGLARFKVKIFQSFTKFYRLILGKEQCNTLVHQPIWPLNFFRRGSMMNQ